MPMRLQLARMFGIHDKGNETMTLSEQLREAIRTYGSVYAVARDSGVSQSVLQRFVTEERDVYLETADRLADFFELELRPCKQQRKGE